MTKISKGQGCLRGFGCLPNFDNLIFISFLSLPLELLGPLVLLVTCGDLIAGGHLRCCYVDNQGECDIYRKGHSTQCVYSASIAKAIYEVADSIGASVSVEKIRRCSDRGAYTADMLSKGNLREVGRMMPLRGARVQYLLAYLLG